MITHMATSPCSRVKASIMYASIFTARGKRFELVIHSTPAISGDSVQAQYYYATRAEAKAAAKAIGAKPWNY